MVRKYNKEIIYGVYSDEEVLLKAVRKAHHDHLDMYDVFTPFPVHGLDQAMHLEESRLHQAGFVYGAIGLLFAFLGMTWIFVKDWPTIFGGKPFWSVPAFIPITFEVTVLFASIGMTVTFYTVCGLWPGIENPQLDLRSTDDKFLIAFDTANVNDSDVRAFFASTGAEEINIKSI